MKSHFAIIFLFLISLIAKAHEGKYQISFDLKKISKNTKVYLEYSVPRNDIDKFIHVSTPLEYRKIQSKFDQVKDSISLQRGKGVLSNTIWNTPVLADLIFVQNNIQADTVKILLGIDTYNVSSHNTLKNIEIDSKIQKGLNEYLAITEKWDPVIKPIGSKLYSHPAGEKKALLQKEYADYQAQLRADIRSFVKNNPDSYGALWALVEYFKIESFDATVIKPLFEELHPDLKNTFEGKMIAKKLKLFKDIGTGEIAPSFALENPKGETIALSDFKGKYVLLDFWASWCRPCRAETPNYLKGYNKYKSKGFEILAVSFDNKPDYDKWVEAIVDDGMIWPNVSGLNGIFFSEIASIYDIRAVPQNFLIDPEGRIIARNIKGNVYQETLDRIFAGG